MASVVPSEFEKATTGASSGPVSSENSSTPLAAISGVVPPSLLGRESGADALRLHCGAVHPRGSGPNRRADVESRLELFGREQPGHRRLRRDHLAQRTAGLAD